MPVVWNWPKYSPLPWAQYSGMQGIGHGITVPGVVFFISLKEKVQSSAVKIALRKK